MAKTKEKKSAKLKIVKDAPKKKAAPKPRAKKEATPCECHAFTGCGADSVGRFAPGHDAKLISQLVSDAMDMSYSEGDDLIDRVFEPKSPLNLKAKTALQNARKKEEAKTVRQEEREKAKAARVSERKRTTAKKRAFEPVEAKIKIGRRSFEAVSTEIDPESGRVLEWQYNDKGTVKTVSHEECKLV